ncbi:MAG: hypothetical protein V1916_01385 [Patescibacteria group bacterium]
MDTVSHAAWGATVVRARPLVWWAAMSGALPDIIPALYGIVRYRWRYVQDTSSQRFVNNPDVGYLKVYHFCHSLIPISVVTVLLRVLAPHYWVLAIPYYLHILLDIPTHRGMWATRLLYPFSDVHAEGFNWWRHHWITVGNWSALVAVNAVLLVL